MSPKILEAPRTGSDAATERRKSRGAVPAPPTPAPPPAPARPSLAIPGLAVAGALGAAVFAVGASLSFDFGEEAALAAPERLSALGRWLASLIGTQPRAWRAAGALALAALAGVAAALVTRRTGRAMLGSVAAAAIATHAASIAWALDVVGVLRLTALAFALGTVLAWSRFPALRIAALGLAVVACLLWPGAPGLPAAGDAIRLALNRPPDAGPLAVGVAAVAAGLALFVLTAPRPTRAATLAASVAAIACCVMGAGTALREIARAHPVRAEEQRFLAALDGAAPVGALDVVLDAPRGRAPFTSARPSRSCVPTIASVVAAPGIRLLHWAPPGVEGPAAALPPELLRIVDGRFDESLKLVEPPADAVLPARSAEDEPEFRFSVGNIAAGAEIQILIVAQGPDRTHVILRHLHDHVERPGGPSGAPVLAWRPAWRPMECAERELRWEDGEVCPRGGTLWWTIAVVDEDGTRLAPFRRVSVAP